MSEDMAFDFSAEVDTDYVRQTANEPDHKLKPARITTKKAWFMSLLVPVLSILASVYPIMNGLIFPTTILGLIFGGIVPLVMIVQGRIDTSKFFLGKLILFAALAAAIFLAVVSAFRDWWLAEKLNFLIPPIALMIAEIIFAAVQKTDSKTKLCLVFSSAAWVYLGSSIDFAIIFKAY